MLYRWHTSAWYIGIKFELTEPLSELKALNVSSFLKVDRNYSRHFIHRVQQEALLRDWFRFCFITVNCIPYHNTTESPCATASFRCLSTYLAQSWRGESQFYSRVAEKRGILGYQRSTHIGKYAKQILRS